MSVDVTNKRTLVEVKNLVKYYPVLGGVFKRVVAHVKAVDDVSFDIKEGEDSGPGWRIWLRKIDCRAYDDTPAG